MPRRAWRQVEAGAIEGFAIVALIAVVGGMLRDHPVIAALSIAGPLVASLTASVRSTTAVSLFAFGAACLLGLAAGIFVTLDELVRLTAVSFGSGVAVLAAHRRVEREGVLARVARVAEVAQGAILRPAAPHLGDIAFAARYLSAAEEALVGGDLYETAYTPDGVRVVLGDVQGKGLDAVRTAALVLGTFREVVFSSTIAQLCERLDERVSKELGDEEFVTAVVVEFPHAGGMQVVNCGHHPPARIRPDGSAELLEAPPSRPLGFGPDCRIDRFPIEAGDRILLYTDGLVEARNDAGEFFELEPRLALLATGPVDEALDRLLAELRAHTGGSLDDDLALVLAERGPGRGGPQPTIGAPEVRRVHLQPEPASAAAARRFVTDALTAMSAAPSAVEAAVIAANELATNALLHARTAMTVSVQRIGGRLRVEVEDASTDVPTLRTYGKEASTGRGLGLVNALADRWGVQMSRVGKSVWFELGGGGAPSAFSDDRSVEAHLLGLPLDVYQESQRHNDALMREFALIREAGQGGDGTVPARLLDLIDDVRARFAPESLESRLQVEAALERGDRFVDLHVNVPRELAPYASKLIDLLDEADAFCVDGELLTLASAPRVRRFRRWYLGQLLDQLDGAEPQPWAE